MDLITGAVFGAAMTASGVSQPHVIFSQLRFEDWHMLQVFLTATASSALIAAAVQRIGHAQPKPRGYSSLGWFTPLDGNIIGGSLLGAGMALSGACPGTVLGQVARRLESGLYALAGAVLGGIVWSGVLQPLVSRRSPQPPPANELTVYESLGIRRSTALWTFEALCVAVVIGTLQLRTTPADDKFSAVAGGLLIGAAQLFSLAARKMLLGVSGSYEDVGSWFWRALKGDKDGNAPKTSNIVFALGVVMGSWALAASLPDVVGDMRVEVPPYLAGAGGFLIVVGSRLAGGCTSGHGISGMSLLAISSIATIGMTFVGGAATAMLLPVYS